jgi:uncharacterized protein YjbJ (UPF0337 family)
MDPKRTEGKMDKLKGDIKQGVGKMTGDKSMQAEGVVDKAKGHVKDAFGKTKDEFRAEEHRQRDDRPL